jgi:putative addiction module component (TIGR02574 family)
MDMSSALKQLEEWPDEDRIMFIEAAWDRLVEKGYDPELTEAQRTVLDRRLAAHQASPNDVTPWQQIRDNLLGQ